jgi:hypothetical protein
MEPPINLSGVDITVTRTELPQPQLGSIKNHWLSVSNKPDSLRRHKIARGLPGTPYRFCDVPGMLSNRRSENLYTRFPGTFKQFFFTFP